MYRLRSVNHNVYFLFAETLDDLRSSKFSSEIIGLSVSDQRIVWFDIWSKCKLYCVPSLRSIIARWDILFSLFCFSIYFLKAWFLVEIVGVLVIIFSARKWWERRILHRLPQTPWGKAASSRRVRVTSDPLSDLRTHHFWASYAPVVRIDFIQESHHLSVYSRWDEG